jgi:tetratricopeptide (TPR) repeat protein
MNRGMVKEKLHDVQGAYTDYTKAIELQENLSKAWLNRGNLFTRQKLYTEAIEDYTAAISYQSNYGAAYFNRAVTYHRLRKLDEACNDLLRAEKFGFPVDPRMKSLFCQIR